MNLVIENLIKILSSIILMVTTVYTWHKLLGIKIDYRNIRNYITIISLSILSIANYYIMNQYIRICSITLVLMIFFKFLFKESLQKSIITPIFSQMIIMVSEMIFAIILILCFKVNPEDFVPVYFVSFFTNLFISIIILVIVQFRFVKKIYNFILKITDKIKSEVLLVLLMILLIAANIFAGSTYYKFDFLYIMIFNILLTIICFVIIMNSLYNKNKYIKVYDKYNTTLNSLKEYEDILDKYRISNHENKNQLLTIRNMIPKSNKKTISYIDALVENKLEDNDKAMIEATKIPAGGLRGLIYSKILSMKNLKIIYDIQISKEVKTVDLINKIDDSLMLDICKIIGVYIDNAIQEVQNLNEKYINIEMYLEKENLIISISNNYKTIIDLDKIDEKGYTTKDKGHGYGLTLTKEIIESNKRLSNEKRLSKEIFVQILKIKM